jgi:hypothetical protein
MSVLASSNGMIAAARSQRPTPGQAVALLTVVTLSHMVPSVVLRISLVQNKAEDDD